MKVSELIERLQALDLPEVEVEAYDFTDFTTVFDVGFLPGTPSTTVLLRTK